MFEVLLLNPYKVYNDRPPYGIRQDTDAGQTEKKTKKALLQKYNMVVKSPTPLKPLPELTVYKKEQYKKQTL